jgi:RHS repeat-associated protein
LIYEYVYTNIEYSPTYGLKKGALGTLLDGSGNDFDQSALLVALLRASGYTASYKYGEIRLNVAQIAAFFDVDTFDGCTLKNLLAAGGIPATMNTSIPNDCTSIFFSADIAHTWVSVTGKSLGTTTAVLDPSYKAYTKASGIGLPVPMGYSQAAFLSSAKSGATITSNSIQNLNSTNINTLLTSYATNLVSHIRATNPTATTRDILGGNYIFPLVQPYALPTSLSYQKPGDMPETWPGDVPDQYRTKLKIQISGMPDQIYFGDAIYGHRLSVVYNNAVPSQPVLYLDGVAQGTGAGNANIITFAVQFPFCFEAGPGAPPSSCLQPGFTDTFIVQSTLNPTPTYTYAIVAGWDLTGRGMVEFHRRQLQINKAAGNADGSEAVLGEALNTVGYAYLAQIGAAAAVNDRLIRSKTIFQTALGVVGQVSGPYIDMPGIFTGTSSLDPDTNIADTAFFAGAGLDSAFEWGTLAQNLESTGVSAVSTVKLLSIANSQGLVIYDATSANWSSVSSQLVEYKQADYADVQSYINSSYRVILPQRGDLQEGTWKGAGYVGIAPPGPLRHVTYKISSNLKGGYTTQVVFPIITVESANITAAPILPLPQIVSFDPIDLSSGAFLYDRDDMSIGSGDFPYSLFFRRSYSSSNLYEKKQLGPGWTHNLSFTAVANSDGLKGFGQDSPIDGAAAIAAAYVAQDLLSDPGKFFDKVLVAALVQKWLMDRLIANSVNVTSGSQAEQFMLLADGSYNPQLGSSSRLSFSGGAYNVKYKDGTSLSFNTVGNISTWAFPLGVTVSFNYDASPQPLLTSVANGLGRTLTLTYNGAKQLVTVSDNATPVRSVTYAYDGVGNLASATDPLGSVTHFSYTPTGGSATAGLLSRIDYPSQPGTAFVTNTYDTLGRVATQTSANGAVWHYFLAGYRSEEVNPYGMRHVLYYNPRGKAQFDIQDYDGSLAAVTKYTYDGLDRLTREVLPEGFVTSGDFTEYTYDTTVNPWANNIASIKRTAKQPSTATITTNYLSDSVFNRPIEINGPPTPSNPATPSRPGGLVTTIVYDPKTGNLASVVPDSTGIKPRTSFTYTALGQVASMTDPVGTVTRYTYDEMGNRTSTIEDAGPAGINLNRTTLYGYNTRGDVTSLTDPNGKVTYSIYDDGRRLIQTVSPPTASAPTGIVTTYAYDAMGMLLNTQQSSGDTILRTESSTWTPAGKPATATDANGNVTRYKYDLLDRQSTLIDAMGRVSEFTYDALSRIKETFNPAVQTQPMLQKTYTLDGLLKTLTDANGNTTTFKYDVFNRLEITEYPNAGTPVPSTEFVTYDDADNITTYKSRANGTFNFTYDTLYRLTSKVPPAGATVTYGYDLAGRRTAISDNSPNITAAVSPTGSTVTYRTTYSYDALNRAKDVNWDPAPSAVSPSAGVRVAFGHTYDGTNRRLLQTADNNTWIAYPPAKNETIGYVSNSLNQYTSVGGVAHTYDGNGNLAGDGANSYAYDAESRLMSVNAGSLATYAFDAQGRLKSRTTPGGGTVISVTDADNREVLEYSGSTGAILRWYPYGLGPNEVLNRITLSNGNRETLVPDIQGSVIGSFNGAGTLTWNSYRAYGDSNGSLTPFGYTGQRYDTETNFNYYRARHYSPTLGRFLQPDPIGYTAGPNLYAYVGNDPLNQTDPKGLAPEPQVIYWYQPAQQQVEQSAGTVQAFVDTSVTSAAARTLGSAAGATAGSLLLGVAAGVATFLYPSATSSLDTCATGGCENVMQYVVRGGEGKPIDFQRGTNLTTNGFGFSVQTAPNVTVEELARGGGYKNSSISVSTVQQLQTIPGVTVTFPTPGGGRYHGTVNVPNPPPPGFYDLIASQFTRRPNPFPAPR